MKTFVNFLKYVFCLGFLFSFFCLLSSRVNQHWGVYQKKRQKLNKLLNLTLQEEYETIPALIIRFKSTKSKSLFIDCFYDLIYSIYCFCEKNKKRWRCKHTIWCCIQLCSLSFLRSLPKCRHHQWLINVNFYSNCLGD